MSGPHDRTGERLALSRHADLKHRAQGAVLVLPERAIRVAGSGAEILALCDGERGRREIRSVLRERYPDTPEIDGEVDRFLAEMIEMGGVVVAASGPEERER